MENLILSGYWKTQFYYYRQQGGFPTSVKTDHANVTGLCYCLTEPNQLVWFLGNFDEFHMLICCFFIHL